VAAALTPLPVLGVPMESASLKGLDSLLSMVQMPGGVPVATFAIGKPGAINAALFAAAVLALSDGTIKKAIDDFRANQTKKVLEAKLLRAARPRRQLNGESKKLKAARQTCRLSTFNLHFQPCYDSPGQTLGVLAAARSGACSRRRRRPSVIACTSSSRRPAARRRRRGRGDQCDL